MEIFENDKISIILPVYNVEEYVEKCLNSILAQTYLNYEVIIVNDGSTDNSVDICKKFLGDKRFCLYNKTNGGLSSARNYGMCFATGAYICFIDSDDFVSKDYLLLLHQSIVLNQSDIAVCNFCYSYNNKLEPRIKHKINESYNNIDAIKEIYKFDSYGVGVWNKLFKAKVLEGIKFPVGKISEDYFVMYKIFYNANKISYINEALYFYVQRDSSITKKKEIFFHTIESGLQFIEFTRDIPELYEYAKMNMVFSAIALYNTGLFNKTLKSDQAKQLIAIVNNRNYKFKDVDIPFNRKLQYILFRYVRCVYNFIFVEFKHIRCKIKGR